MKHEFTALIKKQGDKNTAYIEPPFDVQQVFGAKRVKVLSTFDGVEYRGSIVFMGGIYMLGLTQEIRNKLGKGAGDEIFVTVQKDEEERIVEIPTDLQDEFTKNRSAKQFYDSLSYTDKKLYINWITAAKREETREERVVKTIAALTEGKRFR